MRISMAVGAAVVAAVCCACGGSAAGGGDSGGSPGVSASGGGDDGTAGLGVGGGPSGAGGARAGSGNASAGRNAAAGSSAASGDCAPIKACGGDVLGTWHISHFCAPEILSPTSFATCPDAQVRVTDVMVGGTFTFGAANALSSQVQESLSESIGFPATCFGTTECDLYAKSLSSIANVSSASCSFSAVSGCSCSLKYSATVSTSGTYQLSGTNITIVSGNNMPETDSYCVSGDTLAIQNTSASGQVSVVTMTR